MPILSASGLRQQFASGTIGPLYMLVGADDQEKATVVGEFLDVVEEGLRAFNVDRLYGAETSVDTLLDSANTFPMMAPRRLIIVLEAEKLLVPKRESKAAEEDLARLEAFIERPSPHATIVFVCGGLDMRRRIAKILVRQAHVVDCGTIEDEADAERWVKARAAREKIPLEPAAARALVERAGLDIVRLRAGLERVALYGLGKPAITVEDVRQSVPAGPEAQEDFGIAKAIWRNDAADALRELGLALESGAVPVMVMGQLRAAAEKLNGPRLPGAVSAVFRTDIALKSSGGDPRLLLERLVVELCEGGRPVGPGGGSPGRWNAAGRR